MYTQDVQMASISGVSCIFLANAAENTAVDNVSPAPKKGAA
jgi:hypothetical protein